MKSILSHLHQIRCPSSKYSNVNRFLLKRHFFLSTTYEKNAEVEEKYKLPVQDLLEDSSIGNGPLDEIDENDEWRTSPYPQGAVVNPRQSQGLKSLRPKTDPQDTAIVLFPGEESQHVGMGKELLKFPSARDIFDAANEILKYDLLKLMLKGPKEKLNQPKYCQPAVFICSLAAIEKLKEERPSAIESCIATAGFDVGELTALTFAGVFKFGDALKLVRTRGEAIQLACEMSNGGMAYVRYNSNSKLIQAIQKAKEWCTDRGISQPECTVATYLHPNLKIVAGHTEALKYIEYNKMFYKLDDIKKLPAKGAYHTNLMLPAFSKFRKKLENIDILEPLISVHSNIDGCFYENQEQILRQLPKQIYKPIKWEQMLHILYERDLNCSFPETVICGPSNSLKNYLEGVNMKAAQTCINALQFLKENQSEFKLQKVEPFPASGAFHTNLMLPAVDVFTKVLQTIEMYEPSAYIYSNVDGKHYKTLIHIKKQLPKQIYKPILWEQLIQKIYLRDPKINFPFTYTCGPNGHELERKIRRINNKAAKFCIPVLY
ncbi:hypothetical protein PGB90_000902 [Kerria lacca]